MNVMIGHRLLRGSWTTVLVAATIAIAATVGFCLFDGGHAGGDDHGVSPDLCFGMLITSGVVVLLVGLLPSGWAVTYRLEPVPVVGLRVPAPPPKSTLA